MIFRSPRRAFTITELLIAAPVAAALVCGALFLLAVHAGAQARISDEIIAGARADRVFSILREPLDLAGYGMPKDEDAFRQSFPGSSGAGALSFHSWPGAVSIAPATVGKEARALGTCRIIHAARSHAATTSEAAASGDRVTLELTDNPVSLKSNNTLSPKSWALFGSMHPFPLPLLFAGRAESSKVILRRTAEGPAFTIPANEELYYLRVTAANVGEYGWGDWAFYTDNRDGSGRQPRVAGVVDARFELEPLERTLKVRLLTRGDHRYADEITRDAPDGWPEEYMRDIPYAARHYRLYAFERLFGLRNF